MKSALHLCNGVINSGYNLLQLQVRTECLVLGTGKLRFYDRDSKERERERILFFKNSSFCVDTTLSMFSAACKQKLLSKYVKRDLCQKLHQTFNTSFTVFLQVLIYIFYQHTHVSPPLKIEICFEFVFSGMFFYSDKVAFTQKIWLQRHLVNDITKT